jgi:hypothetical protein
MSVNQMAKLSLAQVANELNGDELYKTVAALNDDVMGWMVEAVDPAACDHTPDQLVENVMWCTQCGQVRVVA